MPISGSVVTNTVVTNEVLAVHYHAIELLINELRSYKVPESIALPIEQGLTTYLQWIEETS